MALKSTQQKIAKARSVAPKAHTWSELERLTSLSESTLRKYDIRPGKKQRSNSAVTPTANVSAVDLSAGVGAIASTSAKPAKKRQLSSAQQAARRQRNKLKAQKGAEAIRDRVLVMLENGDLGEWERGWQELGCSAQPFSIKSGFYTGGYNRFSMALAEHGESPTGVWGTYKQWQAIDCQVKKGCKGTPMIVPVTYWKSCDASWCSRLPSKGKRCSHGATCAAEKGVFFKAVDVYNASQVKGDAPVHPLLKDYQPMDSEDVNVSEKIVSMFAPLGADIRFEGDQAKYVYTQDYVQMPTIEQFDSPEQFAAVMAHELVHWTGNKERCNRKLSSNAIPGLLASPDYAREELVAELGAVLVCGRLGIPYRSRSDHEAYLASWAKSLGAENGVEELEQAMQQAGKAADFIINKISTDQGEIVGLAA